MLRLAGVQETVAYKQPPSARAFVHLATQSKQVSDAGLTAHPSCALQGLLCLSPPLPSVLVCISDRMLPPQG